MLAAVADRVRVQVTQLEKDALYEFGHWFDVAWEIDAPLLCGRSGARGGWTAAPTAPVGSKRLGSDTFETWFGAKKN